MTKKDYKRNNNTATWQRNKQLDEVQQRLLFLNIKLDMEHNQNLSEPDCWFQLKFSLTIEVSLRAFCWKLYTKKKQKNPSGCEDKKRNK